MFVFKAYKMVLVVFLLGIFCPGIVFFAVSKQAISVPNNPVASVTLPTENLDTDFQTIYTVPVLFADGKIINMELETYLLGVVLGEMPASFEVEALKAQAVAARTFTHKQMAIGRKHSGAAVCINAACCQSYCSVSEYLVKGGAESSVEKVRNAVNNTKNIVLLYEGELIEATYFSCSGGRTEDAAAVWGADIPYLQSTVSPGEEMAANFTDTVTFTRAKFAASLGIPLNGNSEKWIGEVTYTAGGGVDTIQICGVEFKGTDVRRLLGLRSTAFFMTAVGDTVTVTTKGFGHRVGMSQYGADAMASTGSTFEQILLHYYQGAQLAVYKPHD